VERDRNRRPPPTSRLALCVLALISGLKSPPHRPLTADHSPPPPLPLALLNPVARGGRRPEGPHLAVDSNTLPNGLKVALPSATTLRPASDRRRRLPLGSKMTRRPHRVRALFRAHDVTWHQERPQLLHSLAVDRPQPTRSTPRTMTVYFRGHVPASTSTALVPRSGTAAFLPRALD